MISLNDLDSRVEESAVINKISELLWENLCFTLTVEADCLDLKNYW